MTYVRELVNRRRLREPRTPVSEIVIDTPPTWKIDPVQPSQCAMVRPRHGGTSHLIKVASGPGKYELSFIQKNPNQTIFTKHYGFYNLQY